MKRKIKFIVRACRWFDRVNGNTYHSVRITRVCDGLIIACPWEYGYGEQYKYTALTAMRKTGWLPGEYSEENNNLHSFEYENNYPIHWEVSDGLKRDMIANGTM